MNFSALYSASLLSAGGYWFFVIAHSLFSKLCSATGSLDSVWLSQPCLLVLPPSNTTALSIWSWKSFIRFPKQSVLFTGESVGRHEGERRLEKMKAETEKEEILTSSKQRLLLLLKRLVWVLLWELDGIDPQMKVIKMPLNAVLISRLTTFPDWCLCSDQGDSRTWCPHEQCLQWCPRLQLGTASATQAIVFVVTRTILCFLNTPTKDTGSLCLVLHCYYIVCCTEQFDDTHTWHVPQWRIRTWGKGKLKHLQ